MEYDRIQANCLTNENFVAIVEGNAPASTDQHDDLIELSRALPEFARVFLPPLLTALQGHEICTFDLPFEKVGDVITDDAIPEAVTAGVGGRTTAKTLFLYVGGDYVSLELIIDRQARTMTLDSFQEHIGMAARLLRALVKWVRGGQDSTPAQALPTLEFGQATARFTNIAF